MPSHPAGKCGSHDWKPGSLIPSLLLCSAHQVVLPHHEERWRSPLESHAPSCRLDLCLPGCDSYCLQCQGPHECTRCEAPFLLLEAQCVQECGKGNFADHSNRRCTGNLETVLCSLERSEGSKEARCADSQVTKENLN